MEMNNSDTDIKKICTYKVKTCLQCGAKTSLTDTKEFFCSQCGAPVLNVCSNYNCKEVLDASAKYCKYCGSTSIFNNYGLLNEFNSISPDNDDDLPF